MANVLATRLIVNAIPKSKVLVTPCDLVFCDTKTTLDWQTKSPASSGLFNVPSWGLSTKVLTGLSSRSLLVEDSSREGRRGVNGNTLVFANLELRVRIPSPASQS